MLGLCFFVSVIQAWGPKTDSDSELWQGDTRMQESGAAHMACARRHESWSFAISHLDRQQCQCVFVNARFLFLHVFLCICFSSPPLRLRSRAVKSREADFDTSGVWRVCALPPLHTAIQKRADVDVDVVITYFYGSTLNPDRQMLIINNAAQSRAHNREQS